MQISTLPDNTTQNFIIENFPKLRDAWGNASDTNKQMKKKEETIIFSTYHHDKATNSIFSKTNLRLQTLKSPWGLKPHALMTQNFLFCIEVAPFPPKIEPKRRS